MTASAVASVPLEPLLPLVASAALKQEPGDQQSWLTQEGDDLHVVAIQPPRID